MSIISFLEQQMEVINDRIASARNDLATQPESAAEDGEASVAVELRSKADANLRFLIKQKQSFEQALKKVASGDYGFCDDSNSSLLKLIGFL